MARKPKDEIVASESLTKAGFLISRSREQKVDDDGYNRDFDVIEVEGRLSNAAEWLDMRKELAFKHKNNKGGFDVQIKAGSQPGMGGIRELENGLHGDYDLRQFQEARERLAESGIMEKLQTSLAAVKPKRTRKFSEYDGDWEESRRYDMEPFVSTHKTNTIAPIVTIEAWFGASGGNIQATNSFGAMVWAICDLLESSGVLTKIVYVKQNTTIGVTTGNYGISTRFKIVAKEWGEYLNPQSLACMLSANFYRRWVWPAIPVALESQDLEVYSGGGHVGGAYTPAGGEVFYSEGVLKICADVSHSMVALEAAIFSAIGQKKVEV